MSAGAQLSGNLYFPFPENGWIVFFNFSSFIFEKYLFDVVKHNKIGVSAICCVFVVQREENAPKMITGISVLGFLLVQKWPLRDGSLFQKLVCWSPYVSIVFGGRACWANW